MNPQNRKQKIYNGESEVQRDFSHELPDWPQELRIIWVTKVLQLSIGETKSKEVKTLPSHLMNFQCSREQKWNRVRVSTVSTRTFQRTQIVLSA